MRNSSTERWLTNALASLQPIAQENTWQACLCKYDIPCLPGPGYQLGPFWDLPATLAVWQYALDSLST